MHSADTFTLSTTRFSGDPNCTEPLQAFKFELAEVPCESSAEATCGNVAPQTQTVLPMLRMILTGFT